MKEDAFLTYACQGWDAHVCDASISAKVDIVKKKTKIKSKFMDYLEKFYKDIEDKEYFLKQTVEGMFIGCYGTDVILPFKVTNNFEVTEAIIYDNNINEEIVVEVTDFKEFAKFVNNLPNHSNVKDIQLKMKHQVRFHVGQVVHFIKSNNETQKVLLNPLWSILTTEQRKQYLDSVQMEFIGTGVIVEVHYSVQNNKFRYAILTDNGSVYDVEAKNVANKAESLYNQLFDNK